MANYVLLYHGGGAPPDSEEEIAKVYQAWSHWLGTAGDKLVDGGAPLGQRKSVSGSEVTDDGSAVNGYSIVSADSIDDAIAFAKGSPHIATGGTVEVAEAVQM